MMQGTVIIQSDRCKGCQLCVHACPQHVLRLADAVNARGYCPVELAPPSPSIHCTGCGVCAVVCPDLVFTVLREPARRRAAA